MRLTSIDQDELDVPDMEYSSAVAMGSQDFLRICREMSAIPGMDTLKISLDSEDDGVVLSGNCDIGSLTYEITSPPDNESQHEEAAGEEGKPGGMHIIRSRGEYSETFGLRYLVTFAKAAQLCSNLTVSLHCSSAWAGACHACPQGWLLQLLWGILSLISSLLVALWLPSMEGCVLRGFWLQTPPAASASIHSFGGRHVRHTLFPGHV